MSHLIEVDSRRLVGLEDDLMDVMRTLRVLGFALDGAELEDYQETALSFQVWLAIDQVCDLKDKVRTLRGVEEIA